MVFDKEMNSYINSDILLIQINKLHESFESSSASNKTNIIAQIESLQNEWSRVSKIVEDNINKKSDLSDVVDDFNKRISYLENEIKKVTY